MSSLFILLLKPIDKSKITSDIINHVSMRYIDIGNIYKDKNIAKIGSKNGTMYYLKHGSRVSSDEYQSTCRNINYIASWLAKKLIYGSAYIFGISDIGYTYCTVESIPGVRGFDPQKCIEYVDSQSWIADWDIL